MNTMDMLKQYAHHKPANIVLLGDKGVGKESLWYRFVTRKFPVWDGPEQEHGRKLITVEGQEYVVDGIELHSEYINLEHTFRLCHGVIFVYSITSRDSFTHIQPLYEQIRKIRNEDQFPAMLVGNKNDLSDVKREVETEEGETLAAALGPRCRFREASAKTGESVDRLFYDIVGDVHERNSAPTKVELAGQSTKPSTSTDGGQAGAFERLKQAFRQRMRPE